MARASTHAVETGQNVEPAAFGRGDPGVRGPSTIPPSGPLAWTPGVVPSGATLFHVPPFPGRDAPSHRLSCESD